MGLSKDVFFALKSEFVPRKTGNKLKGILGYPVFSETHICGSCGRYMWTLSTLNFARASWISFKIWIATVRKSEFR